MFILVYHMMTSSNGIIFHVTGHLCGEFTGHRWIPCTKASDAELWCLLWSAPEKTLVNNGETGDLSRHRAHYDVTVMIHYLLVTLVTLRLMCYYRIVVLWSIVHRGTVWTKMSQISFAKIYLKMSPVNWHPFCWQKIYFFYQHKYRSSTSWLNSILQCTVSLTHWGRGNSRYFADDILKCVIWNENVWIWVKISLKFVPLGPINNIPALVQIMAWRRPGDKRLSEPMMARLPTHICVTRAQWVKAESVMTIRLKIKQNMCNAKNRKKRKRKSTKVRKLERGKAQKCVN